MVTLVMAGVVSASASGASAQVGASVIGAAVGNSIAQQQYAACVGGVTALTEKEAREADAPARALIGTYWVKTRASDKAPVTYLFYDFSPGSWVNNGVEIAPRLKVITDPFARAAGNILSDKPLAFFRGRQGNAARGIWEVTNPTGGRVGYYLADFTRGGDWRLLRLELIPADSPAPEVKPFCAVPGDIEAFHRAAAAMPESEIASRSKKSKPLATCLDGPDCSAKWARAKQWLAKNSPFPLIRDTDALLMTSGPLYPGNLQMAYAVVLDPATSEGQRTIRFRAWCANWVACSPSPTDVRRDFLAALQQGAMQSP